MYDNRKTNDKVASTESVLDDTADSVLVKKIKPNFRKLGQQFGKNMKVVAGLINQMSQEDINTIETTNAFEIEVNGEKHSLSTEDVEITFQDNCLLLLQL